MVSKMAFYTPGYTAHFFDAIHRQNKDCSHKRMCVHSLTKPTSSVEQLIVYKPECTVLGPMTSNLAISR